MSERQPYSRIYWSVRDDAKFVEVFHDDAAFALWVRLLMTADAVWPAAADLPRYAKTKPLARLVEAGIVDLVGDHAYRVHGLDSERERRRDAARTGPKRDPNGTQTGSERVASRDIDENETRTSRDETPRDAADVYWQLTGKYPAGRALDWIDNLASTYGGESVSAALAKAYATDRTVANLLSRSQDILRADARKLDRAEQEDERRRLAEKRAQPRVEEAWRVEYREAIRRQYEGDAA